MPCHTIKTITMELQAADRQLLKKALRSIDVTVDYESGGIIFGHYGYGRLQIHKNRIVVDEGYQSLVGKIRVAYTRQVTERDVRKNGFRMQYTNKDRTLGLRT